MGEISDPSGTELPKRQSKSGSVKSRSGSVKGKLKSSGSVKQKQRTKSSGDGGDDSTQLDMLTPKQNGTMEDEVDGDEKKEKPSSATIKGMWKKAVKSMKSEEKKNWLTKKGSLIRRKDSKEEEIETEEVKVVDPVYSLLKCAADLPKSSRVKSDSPGLGHDFKEYYKLTSPGKKTSPSPFDNIF
ncbi:hypothetical protein SNE40_006863 [Patella caerulea]|uniref:Uncharacterized protein n=1 Tax=Patella caerulea TaxID=87958 RepID=A0AAN8Q720_PATCE